MAVEPRQDGPRVVLHADDFGMNEAVSRGILRGLEQGLLTSASALANAPFAAVALTDWKQLLRAQQEGRLPSSAVRRRLDDPQHPFDLGIHLNLTQGRPLSSDRYPTELLDADGRFPGPSGLFLRLHNKPLHYQRQIEVEFSAQIEFMLDHGLTPTHLNGHQYVEMMPGVSQVVPRIVEKYAISAVRVPLEQRDWLATFLPGFRWPNAVVALAKRFYAGRFRRWVDRHGIAHPDAFFGSSHAGCINLRLLRRFLHGNRRSRLAEIAMHPACPAEPLPEQEDGWGDPLAELRPGELQLLQSPELAEFFIARGLRLGRIGQAA